MSCDFAEIQKYIVKYLLVNTNWNVWNIYPKNDFAYTSALLKKKNEINKRSIFEYLFIKKISKKMKKYKILDSTSR